MEVRLLRHGIAEPRGSKADEDRSLTREGILKIEKAALGMKRLGLRFDHILTSPLVRARQTAEIVASRLGFEEAAQTWEELGLAYSEEALLGRLRGMGAKSRLLLVGHEPDLGHFSSFLLRGEPSEILEFKKGALCEITFDGKPEPGRGRLTWYLLNKHLGLLGKV